MKAPFLSLAAALALLPEAVRAHCPLCTGAAMAAAGGAALFGLNNLVIGLFIGAFATSTGWWVAGLVKRQYIPFQRALIVVASFVGTVLPLLPFFSVFSPFYLHMIGDYGSLLNRTYLINLFLAGSFSGGALLSLTPLLSKGLTRLGNGQLIPFQGLLLTLFLLFALGALFQMVI